MIAIKHNCGLAVIAVYRIIVAYSAVVNYLIVLLPISTKLVFFLGLDQLLSDYHRCLPDRLNKLHLRHMSQLILSCSNKSLRLLNLCLPEFAGIICQLHMDRFPFVTDIAYLLLAVILLLRL